MDFSADPAGLKSAGVEVAKDLVDKSEAIRKAVEEQARRTRLEDDAHRAMARAEQEAKEKAAREAHELAEALARARQDAQQRAREEALRRQQEEQARRAQAQRKPK